jgi:hypothetical protein
MAGLPRFSVPVWPFVGLSLVLVTILGVRTCYESRAAQRAAAPAVAERDIPQLLERLRAGGLKLRAVRVDKRGTSRDNVFLTRTDREWVQLHALPMVPECIERWQGTVYCERVHQPASRELQVRMWGDCCLVAGPFLFFGDRKLLARIRDCLGTPGRQG